MRKLLARLFLGKEADGVSQAANDRDLAAKKASKTYHSSEISSEKSSVDSFLIGPGSNIHFPVSTGSYSIKSGLMVQQIDDRGRKVWTEA